MFGALFSRVDIASMVFFRIVVGFLLFCESLGFLFTHFIRSYFIEPSVMFKYYGFAWVAPAGEIGTYALWTLIGITSLMIMTGYRYREAIAVNFTLFAYFFLLDATHYLNHFYFVMLLLVLLFFVPAHRLCSLDVRLGRVSASHSMPAWALWVLLLQIELVLVYAGIVKLNGDWLLHQAPLRDWLAQRQEIFLIGPMLSREWFILAANYGVIALHMIGAPLLLYRPLRPYVIGIYAVFNLTNAHMFNIGIFPFLTIAATLMTCRPDWPRLLLARLGWKQAMAGSVGGHKWQKGARTRPPHHRLLLGAMALWFLLQLLLPMRAWLYPGDVAWSEEGHRFAWRMKLRDKQGDTRFIIEDPRDGTRRIDRGDGVLTFRQQWKMACRPDLILQYAHHLRDNFTQQRGYIPRVYAKAQCSLNGRPKVPLIDPAVDLAREPVTWRHDPWLLPLDPTLRPSP